MHETYRMLGREHEADLEREAAKQRLAEAARGQQGAPRPERNANQRRKAGKLELLRALIAPFRARGAHADS
jgi:hypothetical protein